eukprot:gene8477-5953_t
MLSYTTKYRQQINDQSDVRQLQATIIFQNTTESKDLFLLIKEAIFVFVFGFPIFLIFTYIFIIIIIIMKRKLRIIILCVEKESEMYSTILIYKDKQKLHYPKQTKHKNTFGALGKAARAGEQKSASVLPALLAAEPPRRLHKQEQQENFPLPREADAHLTVSAQDSYEAIRKRMS